MMREEGSSGSTTVRGQGSQAEAEGINPEKKAQPGNLFPGLSAALNDSGWDQGLPPDRALWINVSSGVRVMP